MDEVPSVVFGVLDALGVEEGEFMVNVVVLVGSLVAWASLAPTVVSVMMTTALFLGSRDFDAQARLRRSAVLFGVVGVTAGLVGLGMCRWGGSLLA